ncbi:hypothetical protein AU191_08805 [Mycolicibacterium acapulense]|nr:hypothetical protein AU191_08805 [Mycolicibacterium acapulense]
MEKSLLVRVVQRAGNRCDDFRDLVCGHTGRVALGEKPTGIDTVDIVHRNPELTIALTSIMDAHDVGMPEGRCEVGLTVEPRTVFRVTRDIGRKYLKCVASRQTGMLNQVNLAHAPRPERANNPEPGELLAVTQRHARMLPSMPLSLGAVGVVASEIAVESFAARETYQRVVGDALRRYKLNRPIKVTAWPPKGSGRGGGDAIARSSALLQALETGTVRIAGHLPALEQAAVGWQQGQHQPDALAALVVAHDVLAHSIGQQWHIVSPLDIERRARAGTITSLPAWMTRRISG